MAKATLALVAALVAAGGYWVRDTMRIGRIPQHLLNHPAVSVPDLLTVEDAMRLKDLAREMAVFPCNVQVETRYPEHAHYTSPRSPIQHSTAPIHSPHSPPSLHTFIQDVKFYSFSSLATLPAHLHTGCEIL
jgi:hypothetical protein